MRFTYNVFIVCAASLLFFTGCKKYLEIPLPVNQIAGEAAYTTDRSSAATITNIFGNLSNDGFFDGANGIGLKAGLYTDELQNISTGSITNQAFYTDVVASVNTGNIWTSLYKQLYYTNLAIEGITASGTLLNKNQWLGEAYFLRGFLHYYLSALYGDVVVTTTSDFLVNKVLPRSPKADVYKQVIADLLKAQSLLTNEYRDVNGAVTINRGRPNKYTATAFLARMYLYNGEWANAEVQATSVINGLIGTTPAYKLMGSADLDKVFLANSAETIFALATIGTSYEKDYVAYNNNMPALLPAPPSTSTFTNFVTAAMNPSLVGAFEKNTTTGTDDLRKTNWVRAVVKPAVAPVVNQTLYFPNKYKSNVAGTEYIMLFRIAEQYLIRAEARAQLNNTDGAKTDINAIRLRAGLTETTAATAAGLVTAVQQERRVELFTEEGHRLFDLRRTGTIDAVMTAAVTLKGGGVSWNSLKQYWPITADDIKSNPNLVQTPGYN